jgi:UPF0271 protein
MAPTVNVNCDLGESFGRWRLGNDEELIRHVPTANVACGFHAGDPHVMRRTVELAREYGVEVGAHVGLPDLVGFGRRRLEVSGDELRDVVLYQLGALGAFAGAAGVPVTHVKPHGVLYAMCGEREEYAAGLLEAVAAVDPSFVVIVGGAVAGELGAGLGLTVTAEGYVDLAYRPDGFPVIERVKEAWPPGEVARRAVRLVKERAATAVDGSELSVDVPTICVHGDAANAVEVARTLRERLAEEGVEVLPLRAAIRSR